MTEVEAGDLIVRRDWHSLVLAPSWSQFSSNLLDWFSLLCGRVGFYTVKEKMVTLAIVKAELSNVFTFINRFHASVTTDLR